jgi:hypothetical protein
MATVTVATMMVAAVAALAKKTKAVTHRQQSTKIGSGRNVGGSSKGNGDDNGNNNDGNGDSSDNNENDSSNGIGGSKEDKGGDTQPTIN